MFLPLLPKLLASPVVTSGLLLMGSGAILALCRKLPESIYEFIKKQCLLEVTILGNDPLFDWTKQWFSQQKYASKALVLTASTKTADGYFYVDPSDTKITLSPGPGNHFFFFKKHLMWITRNRNLAQGGSYSALWHEDISIRILGRNQSIIRELLEEINVIGKTKPKDQITIYSSTGNTWKQIARVKSRPQNSLILPEGVLEDIYKDSENFFNNIEWYHNIGIPYRRGYLLHGIPGSGKTTTALALATKLKLDAYIINLMDKNLGDAELTTLFSDITSSQSMVLLEDIDAAFTIDRKQDGTTTTLTLSGLLNAIDGIVATEGRLLVMTTNHIEKLDPALIRPGRIDRKVQFNTLTYDQCVASFMRFFPDESHEKATEFSDIVTPLQISMAVLQGHLYQYHNDSDEAILNAKNIVDFN